MKSRNIFCFCLGSMAALVMACVTAAAVPAAKKSRPNPNAAVVVPEGSAKPAAPAPSRQSPYARAARENSAAENAAMAEMRAKGQPLPPRLSHGTGPAASKGGLHQ